MASCFFSVSAFLNIKNPHQKKPSTIDILAVNNRPQKKSHCSILLATFLALGFSQASYAAPTKNYTAGKVISFENGDEATRKGFSKYPDLAEIVEGRFSIGNADFNDDGRVEIILMGADSNFCGSGGCQTYVVEILPSKKIKILLSQYFGGGIAMTNEKVNGYRALASVNEGKIDIANKRDTPMHAALHGKQIVYAMQGVSESNTSNPTVGTQTEPAPNPNNATNKSAPSIAGISLGITADEAKRIMTAHFKTYSKQADPIGEVAFVGAPSANSAPFVWQLIAESREGDNAIKTIQRDNIVVTLSPPPNARVVKIKREIRFAIGNEVDIGSLHNQLNAKYGQSTSNAGGSFWFFDRAGRSVKAPPAIKSAGNCKVINSDSSLNNIFNNINIYKKGQAIFGLNPACGVVFELAPASNLKGPTTVAYTGLLDSNGFLNAIVDGFAYLNGQSDAAANQEADKAKKRAVPNL